MPSLLATLDKELELLAQERAEGGYDEFGAKLDAELEVVARERAARANPARASAVAGAPKGKARAVASITTFEARADAGTSAL